MAAHASSVERLIPMVLIVQALCLPCLIGVVFAIPSTGVATLAAYLCVFILLGLTVGLDVRLRATVPVTIGLCAIAVGLLVRSSVDGSLPKVVGVPLAASLSLSTVLLTVAQRRRRRLPPVHCAECGYDLRGAVDDVCPECGAVRRGDT